MLSPKAQEQCDDVSSQPMSPCTSRRRNMHPAAEESTLRVWVRVRPLSERERRVVVERYGEDDRVTVEVAPGAKAVTFLDPTHSFQAQREAFVYDGCFDAFATQRDVFAAVGDPVVRSCLAAFNTTLLAYGQTSSGKTHTMVGGYTPSYNNNGFSPQGTSASPMLSPSTRNASFIMSSSSAPAAVENTSFDPLASTCFSPNNLISNLDDDNERGLTPRIVEGLIDALAGSSLEYTLHASFLEIYNEKVRDLMNMEVALKHPLRVRQHPLNGVFVEGAARLPVLDADAFQTYLRKAISERSSACTLLNYSSSRSHMIIQVYLAQTSASLGIRKDSVMNLVDLAGCERVKQSGVSGGRLAEAASINLSLTTLRRVIDALIEAQDGRKFVMPPTRESSLTWILSDSLGGNSHTTMIATLTPSPDMHEDTLSTLRYAMRARQIVNRAHVNQTNTSRMMDVLQTEVKELQVRLEQGSAVNEEIREELNARIRVSESVVDQLQEQVEAERRRAQAVHEQLQQALGSVDDSRAVERTIRDELAEERSHRDRITRDLSDKESAVVSLREEVEAVRAQLMRTEDSLQDSWRRERELQHRVIELQAEASEQEKSQRTDVDAIEAALTRREAQLAEAEAEARRLRETHDREMEELRAQHDADVERLVADHDAECVSYQRQIDEVENRRRAQCDLWSCREGAMLDQLHNAQSENAALREQVHLLEEEKHYFVQAMRANSDNEHELERAVTRVMTEKGDLERELLRVREEHDELRRWVEAKHFPKGANAAAVNGNGICASSPRPSSSPSTPRQQPHLERLSRNASTASIGGVTTTNGSSNGVVGMSATAAAMRRGRAMPSINAAIAAGVSTSCMGGGVGCVGTPRIRSGTPLK
eukprot:PhM_4_TR4169/c0_g1_i2/m.25861